ncbi:IS1 family transposase, partial [Escherichia coli]
MASVSISCPSCSATDVEHH